MKAIARERPSDSWTDIERRLRELRADLARVLAAIRATEDKVRRLNLPKRKPRPEERALSSPTSSR
jgi:hypothetical protein